MTAPVPRAARFLEQALLANIVVHAVAIVTMGLILMTALPGGPTKDDAVRVAFIAEHPWLWRLGWLPWHLCALFDLVMGVALVTTRWVPRLPAVLTLLVTLCAVVPEQTGEINWVSRGVALAQDAHRTGELEPYLQFEAWAFHLAVVVGASIYMVMALGWTWCFIAAGTWNRVLSWLTPFTWGLLAVGSVGLLLPEPFRPGDALVGVTNGVGFLLLQVWLILVTEAVLRRSRPDEAHGRMAPWRHPWSGWAGRALDAVANSRFVRALCEWLPVPAFRSDIRDVIYCNYVVEADRLLPLVPAGLELQRLGPDGRWALFTHLTYRHGHFGPALLGPLRRLLPSPVHTNWRIYVRARQSGRTGIYFVTNAIASTLHALAARLLSEGMPMHALADGEVLVGDGNEVSVRLNPGGGSGPDLEADLRPGPAELPAPFDACWSSYGEFLEYAVPQDRSFSVQQWYERLTRQEIELGIPLDVCHPLTGQVFSKAALALLGQPACVSFRVPSVAFRFDREERDRLVSV
jgi:Uncharacterized conserved protein (COG2071)/Domain of unknown function (DUF4386)